MVAPAPASPAGQVKARAAALPACRPSTSPEPECSLGQFWEIMQRPAGYMKDSAETMKEPGGTTNASDPLAQALTDAAAALQVGDHGRAAALYRELAAQDVADVRPYCNLAALALLEERSQEAIAWLERGLGHEPDHAWCLLNLGMALHLEQRDEEAVQALRRALAREPKLVEAWNNLGVALAALNQPEEAMEAYRRALALQADHAKAAVNLSVLLASHRNPAAGEELLRRLPEAACNGSVLFHLGEMLRLQGRGEEALAAYGQCLEREPADWDLRFGVGLALISCGQADGALEVLLPLLAMRPDDDRPLFALGWSLYKIGELDQAIELLERAVQRLQQEGARAKAHNVLGLCHVQLGSLGEAIRQFRAGLELEPTDGELRCNLAAALRSQGDLEGSMAEIDALLSEQPQYLGALIIQMFSCSIASEALASLNLDLARRYWQQLRQQSTGLVLREANEGAPPSEILNSTLPLGHSPLSPEPLGILGPGDSPPIDGRLRIGFLSAEIGDHVVGSFLSSFLEGYDRDRFAVELFMTTRRFDPTATRLAARADRHWLLCGMQLGQARELIRQRRLDVLVETSGFTADSGIDLLAERCAPIQCHYIGYHASTGLDTIDWFLGDEETVPEEFAPQFVENLWRLPRPWLAQQANRQLPPAISSHSDGPPVLGSFNQMAKVRGETLRYWAAALQAVPEASLLLKDRATRDSAVRERILAILAGEGIAAERIRFLPHQGTWQEHMALYNQLDVALDTTPWSSATTGFDALSMGVPLVAIRGGCTSARMSAAILRGLGRPEWIASTPERYGAIVAALCTDLAALRHGKQALREELLASALMDGAHLSRALEQAFSAMVAGQGAPRPA
jgi:protein O-GlcNAc transferase